MYTADEKQQVLDSYKRCLLSGTFFDDFYDDFTRASPQVAEKFRHTAMDKQKNLLRVGLRHLINFYFEPDAEALQTVRDIGESHSKLVLNIAPELYELWLESLMRVVAEHDPKFSEPLGWAWRDVMRHGIAAITAFYE
jgi:hemoglobin-like flavoprotein